MLSIFKLFTVGILFVTSTVFAQLGNSKNFETKEKNAKICKGYLKLVSNECSKSICLNLTDEATDDCDKDGAFWESYNMCVYEDLLPGLIKDYNNNHPTKKINCDDVEVI